MMLVELGLLDQSPPPLQMAPQQHQLADSQRMAVGKTATSADHILLVKNGELLSGSHSATLSTETQHDACADLATRPELLYLQPAVDTITAHSQALPHVRIVPLTAADEDEPTLLLSELISTAVLTLPVGCPAMGEYLASQASNLSELARSAAALRAAQRTPPSPLPPAHETADGPERMSQAIAAASRAIARLRTTVQAAHDAAGVWSIRRSGVAHTSREHVKQTG